MKMSTDKGVALVTGAARGIGRAIALKLANDGYNVAVNDLKTMEEELGKVVEEIKALGRNACVVCADMSVEKDVAEMVQVVVKELGSLDVMVANAGILLVDNILDATVDNLDRVFGVNIRGVMLCYQYAAKQMIAQGRGGRIIVEPCVGRVTIGASSQAGKVGSRVLFSYSATKFAVRGMTQSAAQELAKYGITVNAYAPGYTDTRMIAQINQGIHASGGPSNLPKVIEETTPVGRAGTPEEIAALVSYLASKEAAFVTGQSMSINGGCFFD
ncbi:hypothetical protein OF83DRAFT_354321 [Amylostereum chailletii]|nr:hypothetical protein OF83DRAFT_354321 [Amylostereum chailletii]